MVQCSQEREAVSGLVCLAAQMAFEVRQKILSLSILSKAEEIRYC